MQIYHNFMCTRYSFFVSTAGVGVLGMIDTLNGHIRLPLSTVNHITYKFL